MRGDNLKIFKSKRKTKQETQEKTGGHVRNVGCLRRRHYSCVTLKHASTLVPKRVQSKAATQHKLWQLHLALLRDI